jgi:quinoprotein glucose dehydrogenase
MHNPHLKNWRMPMRCFVVLVLILFCTSAGLAGEKAAFVSLFDGKTLNGWSAPDMSYWSVEDGAITGIVSAEHPNLQTRYLVWQGGEVGDFELKLKFRIQGSIKANSGIQFRTTFNSDDTQASGYQADLVRDPVWMGLLYEEGGRKVLAHRGEKTVINETGERNTKEFANPEELFKVVRLDGWNEYQVIARGDRMRAIVNGKLMSEVIDNDKSKFHASGWIGLQLHRGPPMKIQFKDILLEKYPSKTSVSVNRTWALENPLERAALPEFQEEPAAKASELTPANGYPRPETYVQWQRSNGDATNSRFSALDQINRHNVNQLQIAWVYHSNDGKGNIECNPIIVEGVMYAPTPGASIVAVNAATGEEIWRFNAGGSRTALRGLVYWKGDGGSQSRILFNSGAYLFALDAKTGVPIHSFGSEGKVQTGPVWTAGAIYKHVFVIAGGDKDVFGYDLTSGRQLWTFHTIPAPGEFGYDTWEKTEKGANSWGGIAMDEHRGIVYIATGSPKPNFIGVGHHGRNLFGNCVIALNASSGKRIWHFQEIRHDIWDLDIPAPPNLVTVMHDGRKIDAVAQVTKIGDTLLLDRVTGKPLFPFRLRRAPVSKLPGEQTWPYQPDPQLPERLAPREFTLNDVTDRTPDAHKYVMQQLANAHFGWFEPFEEGKPTALYNLHGGAEWTGAAFDPTTGFLYINVNRYPWIITLFRTDEPRSDPRLPPTAGQKVYSQTCAVCHGEDRMGQGVAPPLRGLSSRFTDEEVLLLLQTGRGMMPPIPSLTRQQQSDLLDFIFLRDKANSELKPAEGGRPQYAFKGYFILVDQEGYPGSKPPWGSLVCLNLNNGTIVWKVTLGEYMALTAQGIPKTGTPNMGGAIVTAGGLVFCAGTRDNRIRAFDKQSGAELWEGQLPWGGYAPPATYQVNKRQFVVIAATGGGFPAHNTHSLAGPNETGDAYVAFALPETKF